MSEPSRAQKIADVLRPVLAENEAFVVRQQQGNVHVTPLPGHVLRDAHPRLYGQLLSANEQLSVGCGVFLAGLILAGLACAGFALGWWDHIIGKDAADELRSVWLYQFLFLIGLGIPGYIVQVSARRHYRALRGELLASIEADGLDRDTLVAIIQDDPALSTICRYLKLDRGLRRADQTSPNSGAP